MPATISAHHNKNTKSERPTPQRDEQSAEVSTQGARWYASTFALAMCGALLLYLAFPPVAWWPLAWVAPVPWLLLIRAERMSSGRPYRWLYLVGLLHWLALVQWVRLGHWAAHFGWIALSLYLACYLPLLICLTRVAMRRFRVPLVIAAPVIWVGLECLRGWLLTGFSMALLGHTQIHWLQMVQISDLVGAYGVSFLLMFVAAALAEVIPLSWLSPSLAAPGRGMNWWPLPLATLLFAAAFWYGHMRMNEESPSDDAPTSRIALIQGSIDTDFHDPTLNQRMFDQYRELTSQALTQRPDAILWPESTLPFQMIEVDRSGQIQKSRWLPQDDAQFNREIDEAQRGFLGLAYALGHIPEERRHVPLLLGTTTLRLGDHPPQRLNSAVYVDQHGRVDGAYHKLKPVMFGEYAPGGKLFPWIYELMPIPEGLTPGEAPKSLEIAGLRMCPSICYENTVPHLIRRQVVQLQSIQKDPDVLVTLSNDGWFYGSAELDMHLVCGQFRAIEMRKPMLVAANTGISAHIADDGRLVTQGPKRQKEVVIASVQPAWRSSIYVSTGDLLANTCLFLCGVLGIGGIVAARVDAGGQKQAPPAASKSLQSDPSGE